MKTKLNIILNSEINFLKNIQSDIKDASMGSIQSTLYFSHIYKNIQKRINELQNIKKSNK